MKGNGSIEHAVIGECLQTITTAENGEVTGIFSFGPDFPAFEGHFPGKPVLPAVVQLAAVRLLASRHLDSPLAPITVERAKFKTMIGPEEPVSITIQLDQSAHDVTISFTITTGKGKAATGEISCRIVLDERNPC